MPPSRSPQPPPASPSRSPASGKWLAALAILNIVLIALVMWRNSPRTSALAFWVIGTAVFAAGLLALAWASRNAAHRGFSQTAANHDRPGTVPESPSRKFADRLLLRSSLESGKCVCLAAGIDDFEGLAERHGPTVAEAVLYAVSQTLDANLRTSDIVGRIGDGVFAVVMPTTTHEGARITADRIRVAVSQLEVPTAPDHTLRLSLSIGLCTLRPEDSVESLLDRSCEALAQARAQEPGSLKVL